jgi:hypothetical protein
MPMRDLWNDLARRVRAANQIEPDEVPFGFSEAVFRRLQAARRGGSNLLDDWVAVLRPALGLAIGAAAICLLLQFRVEKESTTDAVAQTEALIQLALLND